LKRQFMTAKSREGLADVADFEKELFEQSLNTIMLGCS